jgi:hypothetical protein
MRMRARSNVNALINASIKKQLNDCPTLEGQIEFARGNQFAEDLLLNSTDVTSSQYTRIHLALRGTDPPVKV